MALSLLLKKPVKIYKVSQGIFIEASTLDIQKHRHTSKRRDFLKKSREAE